MVGICISLTSNNIEDVFISLLVICKFPFMKYVFHQMFLPRLLILLSCKLLNLYMTLSDICIVNILPTHFLNNNLMKYLILI